MLLPNIVISVAMAAHQDCVLVHRKTRQLFLDYSSLVLTAIEGTKAHSVLLLTLVP